MMSLVQEQMHEQIADALRDHAILFAVRINAPLKVFERQTPTHIDQAVIGAHLSRRQSQPVLKRCIVFVDGRRVAAAFGDEVQI